MLPVLAFGFGGPWDIAIIAGVVVLLFGGAKIAGFGKHLGEGMKEFKNAARQMNGEDETPPVSTAASLAATEPVKPAEPMAQTSPAKEETVKET